MTVLTEWMSPEEFRAEQRRLEQLLTRHYGRRLAGADIEEIVADALLQCWRHDEHRDPDARRVWVNQVAINAAKRRIVRDRHGDVDSLDDDQAPIDQESAITLSEGRQALLEDLTAVIDRKERVRARAGLITGLARLRPLDVRIHLDATADDLSHDQIAARRGVSRRRTRKAVERVSKFLVGISGLVDDGRLDEDEAMALALHHAGVATPAERAHAARLLARPDGPQLHAAVTEAMRRGAYLPLLSVDQDPGRQLAAPLGHMLASARHQVAQWTSGGKETIATSVAQYAPVGSGVRPGAALGAALALCVGGGAVCVDQGVLPSPLGSRQAERPRAGQSVKAPKPLRARPPRAKSTSASGPVAARPASQAVRLRAPAAPPRARPAPAAQPAAQPPTDRAGGGEFGGSSSEFGGSGGGGAGAGTSAGGGEFGGGGGSSGGGSSSSGGSAGGGGEFGIP